MSVQRVNTTTRDDENTEDSEHFNIMLNIGFSGNDDFEDIVSENI